MPQFNYVAIDGSGRRLHQVVSADSKIAVANTLKKNNYFIVEITEVTAKESKLPKRLSLNDKLFFTQNIATLLSSGMPLSSSLAAIAEDTTNKQTIALYNAIRTDLERGFTFYKALARYPEIFDPVYLSLIEAGESSGKLDTIMADL
jgi:general secretion pathway protein F